MARIAFRYGWLLYVGTMGGGPDTGLAVSGDVMDVDVSMERGVQNVHTVNSPYAISVAGSPEITVRARMGGPGLKMVRGQAEETALWNALTSWAGSGPGAGDGRRWPPQLRAMAELARRHPEEYHHLMRTETAAGPPRVVRHSWLDG